MESIAQISPDLLQEGGFAFAALIMAGVVVLGFRGFTNFMKTREGFIDRLLTRLESMENEYKELVEFQKSSTQGMNDISRALQEIHIALARMNGRSSGEG